MADETVETEPVEEQAEPVLRTLELDTHLELRDAQKRELDIRIVPYDTVIRHEMGPEMFVRGAFEGVDPTTVLLRGPDAQGKHTGPVVGRGTELHDRTDGAHMTFKVSRTQAGDELLTLYGDGVIRKASASFWEVPGGHSMERVDGQRVRVQRRVGLDHVATTWRPAYERAEILAMRSEHEGDTPMAEAVTTPPVEVEAQAQFPAERFMQFMEKLEERSGESSQRLLDRIAKLEERERREITLPTPKDQKGPTLFDWVEVAFRTMRGETIRSSELHDRALDDVIVTDNPGQVPDAFVDNVIGLLPARRPFLATTTQIAAPDTGMSIVVPVVNQHATADVQSSEKTEIESTATKVGLSSFDAISVFGGADVSIQIIRRATRATMDLLFRDLARAYARKADAKALQALFTAGTTPGTANIDPEDLEIGEAWENSINATDEPPDTIWLSAAAVKQFINAKNDGTNAPLWWALNANIAAGNNPSGSVSALRPVYVPALTGTSVDVMIGPSSGFVWAEDGTFQLQADNVTLAGRDIALGGILFFVPRYPSAFTTYDLGS